LGKSPNSFLRYADRITVIVFTNEDFTSLRVGKTAYLFQIFVFPDGLYVLLFGHILFLKMQR
jgi:hypothetical protein